MAATATLAAPSFLAHQSILSHKPLRKLGLSLELPRTRSVKIRAAKLPAGVSQSQTDGATVEMPGLICVIESTLFSVFI